MKFLTVFTFLFCAWMSDVYAVTSLATVGRRVSAAAITRGLTNLRIGARGRTMSGAGAAVPSRMRRAVKATVLVGVGGFVGWELNELNRFISEESTDSHIKELTKVCETFSMTLNYKLKNTGPYLQLTSDEIKYGFSGLFDDDVTPMIVIDNYLAVKSYIEKMPTESIVSALEKDILLQKLASECLSTMAACLRTRIALDGPLSDDQ